MFIDPQLISISKCGKYVYPVDSITGAKTFAPVEYFKKKVQEKYDGKVERFVKEYVSRETNRYLKEGWSSEQLREMVRTQGKLPKLNKKPKKDPNAPKKQRRKRLTAHVVSTKVITNNDGIQETVKVYPWSSDPVNYFKSPPRPVNIAEWTKYSCLRPDIRLDHNCRGCPYYTECTCKLKNLKLKTS